MDAVIKLVKPEIHQRRKKLEQLGEDWEDKPVRQDVLTQITELSTYRDRRTTCCNGALRKP